jgi:hypothetical protein
LSLAFGPGQRREQHRGQDGDDGNHHKQLYQRKTSLENPENRPDLQAPEIFCIFHKCKQIALKNLTTSHNLHHCFSIVFLPLFYWSAGPSG